MHCKTFDFKAQGRLLSREFSPSLMWHNRLFSRCIFILFYFFYRVQEIKLSFSVI